MSEPIDATNAQPKFKWVKLFQELAKQLRKYKSSEKRETLVKILKRLADPKTSTLAEKWTNKINTEQLERLNETDPFSIFALFNLNEINQPAEERNRVFFALLNTFNIPYETSFDFSDTRGIPTIRWRWAVFGKEKKEIENLWALFEMALDYADGKTIDRDRFATLLKTVNAIKGVDLSNITMALSWIDPEVFLSFDRPNLDYIADSKEVPETIAETISQIAYHRKSRNPDEPNQDWTPKKDWTDHYLSTVEAIRTGLKNAKQPLRFYELSDKANEWKKVKATTTNPPDSTNNNERTQKDQKGVNWENEFRDWLPDHKVKNSIDKYVESLKAIAMEQIEKTSDYWYGLIHCLTGETPSVGVFQVKDLNEFIKHYGAAKKLIDCKTNDRKNELKNQFSKCSCFDEVYDFLKRKDSNNTSGVTRAAIKKYMEFLKEHECQAGAGESENKAESLKDRSGGVLSRNLIYFGAPGTGKSFKLKEAVEAERNENGEPVEAGGKAIDFERVTFYPTYSYAQFVGCYKPVMKGTNAGDKKTEEISYEFVPGPFLRVLVKALERPGENHCLVIEEINRANAAAVFGDVFQLLDRATEDSKKDERVKKGESEYGVAASEDIRRYLTQKIGSMPETKYARTFLEVENPEDGTIALDANGNWASCRLRIPSNMYIWATMNSADQGVFPMDTAFKRRWKFKYFGINQSDDKIVNRTIGTDLKIDEKQVYDTTNWNDKMRNWNSVRKFVNRLLTLFKVNEDKLMGPWFVQPESGDEISAEQFESKVLMYLWEDAARMCRQKMFPSDVTSYSELITEWRKQGVGIFEHLMGENQIGKKDNDKNNANSATNLWEELKVQEKQP